jgi:hypothetical protein
MRHGRKSARRRFEGHKGAVAVDPDSQLILSAAVLPGNAQDREGALGLVEQAEADAGVEVEEAIGDCAYGDGDARRAFADAGRRLVANAPQRRGQARFPKDAFRIDPEAMACVCPRGHECRTVVPIGARKRCGDAPCGPSASTPPCATPARSAPPACARGRGSAGR